ncbi:hypothetical protein [Mesorhizobium sp. CO1-1-8]|uniref:hypothetical protein n=1 Tax=Mesorhizobium sp. CO1-1-8 TaxID=2876631 RepID=UPI001CD0D2A7|nr:hypothetical protein [Mesorhizobium sp. CO1-1-8]MBZ9775020.1 hypothetical protein [Mesorhizobium sp. CO1-1-8]
MIFHHILVARILITVATLGWSAIPVRADINATHATNPAWTPHARFHVVWQVSSYAGFGMIALALIWWPGAFEIDRLYFAALMGAVIYASFFVALAAMPLYDGATHDKNGYLPFNAPMPVIARKWDANITAFSVMTVILAAGAISTAL